MKIASPAFISLDESKSLPLSGWEDTAIGRHLSSRQCKSLCSLEQNLSWPVPLQVNFAGLGQKIQNVCDVDMLALD